MSNYKYREITCEGCGKIISGNFPKNKKFCSHECYKKSPRTKRKTGELIQCEFCKKEVYKKKSVLSKNQNNFCSKECANEYQKKNKLEFICKICKKKFLWSKSRVIEHNPTYCSINCRNKDLEWIENACIKGNLIQQKKKGLNNIELLGREILNDLNLQFEEQVLIKNKFLVDVFVPKYNLIIQWDGDYWHCHSKYTNPNKTQLKRKQLDSSQDAYLKKCGYNVLRFWETDIKNERVNNDYIRKTIQSITK